MDYHRIYSGFIKDRRAKEASLTGYTECHHILPRCLGGGNEAENLIRLTPEDHYFAHLVLAKMHGGKLWVAVHAMAYLITKGMGRKPKLQLRAQFGHVRRALAAHYKEVLSGAESPISDSQAYELRHEDGRILLGRRFYLEKRSGVPRQQISALLRGAKKTAHGWHVAYHNPAGLTRSEQISAGVKDKTVHTLYHFDGRIWSGTFAKFREMTGSQMTWQSDRHKQIKGWYFSKEECARHAERISAKAKSVASARGDISGAGNPRYDGSLYEFFNHFTGERRLCTRHELCVSAGIPYGDMSYVLAGKRQSAKDWTLWQRRHEKFRKPMGYRGRSATSVGANG